MGNFIPKQYQMFILCQKLAFKNYNASALLFGHSAKDVLILNHYIN
jgi:hypothetical protein